MGLGSAAGLSVGRRPAAPVQLLGYDVNPVWDDGFGQWGIWLFGLWIPIFGIGVQ